MSFMTSGGSDCSQIDPMSALLKQFQRDRSLQQDRISFQQGESSKSGFRSIHKPNHKKLTEEFFKQEFNHTFEFNGLNRELELLNPPSADWAAHFMQQQRFGNFENHQNQSQEIWTKEFENSQAAIDQVLFKKAFDEAQGFHWENEPSPKESWAAKFDQITTMNNEESNSTDMLLNSSDIESNLQYMNLMKHSSDKETVEDSRPNGSVESTHPSDSINTRVNHTEFHQRVEWARELYDKHNPLNRQETVENNNALFSKGTEMNSWAVEYQRNMDHLQESRDDKATMPDYDTYKFSLNNPYLIHSELILGREHASLADSILALEAKTHLEISNANSWMLLGIKQQENEKDVEAIAALRKAVKINPSLLDAWSALAVSYANEGSKMDALDALENWILHNQKYLHFDQHTKQNTNQDKHTYITHMFLEAARSSPGVEMDPEIQICLGVLFNISREYHKAVDCFKAALVIQPKNYLLWNKLGATLANSKDPASAIVAYSDALEINPNYVRARYNMAISFMNLGQHDDAVVHLLSALTLQNTLAFNGMVNADTPKGMSDSIWDTLRILMTK